MSSGPRSTPRTRRILEAAIAIIAERGLRGLTHRAVDAQAGLPEGSTSGYYRTRLALLTGTAEFLRDQLLGGVEHAVGQIGSAPSDDLVIDAVVELLDGWLAEPAIIVVVAELKLEGLRTPEIDEAFAAWREELIDFVAQTTARIGSDDPRLKATGPARILPRTIDFRGFSPNLRASSGSPPADRRCPQGRGGRGPRPAQSHDPVHV